MGRLAEVSLLRREVKKTIRWWYASKHQLVHRRTKKANRMQQLTSRVLSYRLSAKIPAPKLIDELASDQT